MKKTLIYPFDSHCLPLLKHSVFPIGYKPVSLVAPKGWGFDGLDAGEIDSGESLGLKITDDFQSAICQVDVVFFTQSDTALDFETFVFPKICQAILAKKEIICSIPISKAYYNSIYALAKSQNVLFNYINNNFDYTDLDSSYFNDKKIGIWKIHTPVIAIAGMAAETGKFDTQLALHQFLLENGYNSILVTSRQYSNFFNFYSIPSYFYSYAITESEKILLFNNYIKNIENKHTPDVIVIGIPGGIMQLADDQTDEFGILCYEITRAIQPDSTILCLFDETFNADYFSKLYNFCKYRFSAHIDGFVIDNKKLDWNRRDPRKRIPHIVLDARDQVQDLNQFEHLVRYRSGRDDIFNGIIVRLTKNAIFEEL